MSKKFLTPKQIQKIKSFGWQELPTKDGAMWFGTNWDNKRNILGLINKTIDVSDAEGYDFLIVGYRKNQFSID
ncbi:MAG: hypothetical protein ACPG2Y_01165 [Acholeplasmataceae bacterium]